MRWHGEDKETVNSIVGDGFTGRRQGGGGVLTYREEGGAGLIGLITGAIIQGIGKEWKNLLFTWGSGVMFRIVFQYMARSRTCLVDPQTLLLIPTLGI